MTRRRWIAVAVLVAVAAALSWGLYERGKTAKGQSAGSPTAGAPPVPVIVARATQRDMPVYLDGLGSVSAFNTVTVKSRVDGQLVKVAFTEGQEVRQGDLLALIDPRTFEIQVRQSEAALAREQVSNANNRTG